MMSESDEFRRAQAEGLGLEEVQALADEAVPKKFGLPTTWRNADGPVVHHGRAAVLPATEEDVKVYVDDAPTETCGSCRYFDLELGRTEIVRQRFAERLVREHGWQMKHLCVPPDSIGLCGASDGEMATTVVSKACDQYRSRGSGAGRWRMVGRM
jgi:hypothetical protein